MKFFKTRKSEQVDPRGGFVMYPEFCIDTNPKFAHNLTVQEVMILEQDAEIAALCARVERLEGALKPFAADDLCQTLGGNCDGVESVVFGRKNTELKLKHFIAARAVLSESAASVHDGEKRE